MDKVLRKLEQEKIAQRQTRLKRALPLSRISMPDITAERSYQRTMALRHFAQSQKAGGIEEPLIDFPFA